MSVKHVERYYDEVQKNYLEMQKTLRCMEEEASKNMVPPEALENMKTMVAALVDNYQKLSYIMYLLHQPNKKQKQRGYEKRNKELLARCGGKDSSFVAKQNRECIENVKRGVKNGTGS